MNNVYLDKDGNVFVNGNEIKNVVSISTKTSYTGAVISIEFTGDYKSEYIHDKKVHSLDECTKE